MSPKGQAASITARSASTGPARNRSTTSTRTRSRTRCGARATAKPRSSTSRPAAAEGNDEINEARYRALKGIRGAKKKPPETLSLAEIGVDASHAGDAGSKTEVLSLSEPPSRGDARRIEGDGNAAQAIVD